MLPNRFFLLVLVSVLFESLHATTCLTADAPSSLLRLQDLQKVNQCADQYKRCAAPGAQVCHQSVSEVIRHWNEDGRGGQLLPGSLLPFLKAPFSVVPPDALPISYSGIELNIWIQTLVVMAQEFDEELRHATIHFVKNIAPHLPNMFIPQVGAPMAPLTTSFQLYEAAGIVVDPFLSSCTSSLSVDMLERFKADISRSQDLKPDQCSPHCSTWGEHFNPKLHQCSILLNLVAPEPEGIRRFLRYFPQYRSRHLGSSQLDQLYNRLNKITKGSYMSAHHQAMTSPGQGWSEISSSVRSWVIQLLLFMADASDISSAVRVESLALASELAPQIPFMIMGMNKDGTVRTSYELYIKTILQSPIQWRTDQSSVKASAKSLTSQFDFLKQTLFELHEGAFVNIADIEKNTPLANEVAFGAYCLTETLKQHYPVNVSPSDLSQWEPFFINMLRVQNVDVDTLPDDLFSRRALLLQRLLEVSTTSIPANSSGSNHEYDLGGNLLLMALKVAPLWFPQGLGSVPDDNIRTGVLESFLSNPLVQNKVSAKMGNRFAEMVRLFPLECIFAPGIFHSHKDVIFERFLKTGSEDHRRQLISLLDLDEQQRKWLLERDFTQEACPICVEPPPDQWSQYDCDGENLITSCCMHFYHKTCQDNWTTTARQSRPRLVPKCLYCKKTFNGGFNLKQEFLLL